MAVEGNLKDLSLTGLVQTICLEQRQAVLFLTRPGEKGAIFFEGGEIAHAEVGSLEGEEAMYRLLAWPDGTFRLGEHAAIPRRTVSTPWSNLLLEAMRRLDEQERMDTASAPAERVLSPAEVQQDQDLENDLILLLSELEQSRVQLAEEKSQKQPPLALQTLAEMVNHVVSFAEERLDIDRDSLEQALTRAGGAYPQTRLLRIQYRRLSVQMVTRLYSSWAEDPAGRRETFLQIAQGMVDVMETYFSILTARFHSPVTTEQWRDTSDVFTTDLKQVVGTIRF